MDLERLFKHQAFSQLLPEQMQLLKQFAGNIQGKGSAEIARLYMQLSSQINKIRPISATQRNAIVEAIRNFLPEKDRQKLNGFIKMLGR